MKTKKAILISPGKFEIEKVEISPKSNEVLVKVAVCGLCNWELNHWKGLLGIYPQTLGHEWAGEVVEVGSNVQDIKIGDKITVPIGMGGFAEYAVADQENCFKLDATVNLQQVLGEPLKCVVTVLRATDAEAGDCGIVLGCGPMGLWCIQALAGNFLSTLIAVDIDDDKLALAKKFGATHVINSKTTNVEEAIQSITGGHMADFVIEGTGIPAVLNNAINYLRTGRGRLILMSSHEDVAKEFDFREAINRGTEIRVAHGNYSLNQREDMRRAVTYIDNGTFNMEYIITHKFKLEDINEAFHELEHKSKDFIKGVVLL